MSRLKYGDLKIGVPTMETDYLTFGDLCEVHNAVYRGEIKRYRKYFLFGPVMLKRIRKQL